MGDAARLQRRSSVGRQLGGEFELRPGHLGEQLVRRPGELRTAPVASKCGADRPSLGDPWRDTLLLVGLEAEHPPDGEFHQLAPIAATAAI
jgi:hypothetical protein